MQTTYRIGINIQQIHETLSSLYEWNANSTAFVLYSTNLWFWIVKFLTIAVKISVYRIAKWFWYAEALKRSIYQDVSFECQWMCKVSSKFISPWLMCIRIINVWVHSVSEFKSMKICPSSQNFSPKMHCKTTWKDQNATKRKIN